MMTRPMPRRAERYLNQPDQSCGPFANGFYAWLLRTKPHTPRLVRGLALPFVYLVLIGCAVADEIDLQLAQLSFRTVDRYATRIGQWLILFAVMMLSIWLVNMLCSPTFWKVVL